VNDDVTRPKCDGCLPICLDERPLLDAGTLRGRGLTTAEIEYVMRGSSCVSEQELHDRLLLMKMERGDSPGSECA
jgi:hypothetical protein